MTFRKELEALYLIENITSSAIKKRIRNNLYRLDTDWDPTKMPALAVAFAYLALSKSEKYPGWIIGYQHSACYLSDRIETEMKNIQ